MYEHIFNLFAGCRALGRFHPLADRSGTARAQMQASLRCGYQDRGAESIEGSPHFLRSLHPVL